MFCSKCGKELPDGTAFCPHCGTRVGIPAGRPALNQGSQATNSRQPGNAGTNTIAIIIGAIVILALIALGIVFLTKNKTDDTTEKKEEVKMEETVKDTVVITKTVVQEVPADSKKSGGISGDPYAYVSTTYLSDNDLYNVPKSELRLMRNAIYAHHGYKFKSADLKKYFGQFSWYVPTRSVVSPNEMSEVEQYNLRLIQSWE